MQIGNFYLNVVSFFFFNDTATTEIYTLSLHDALPIFANAVLEGIGKSPDIPDFLMYSEVLQSAAFEMLASRRIRGASTCALVDRKSTRLNSSHSQISYAVFCLKKKNATEPR